MVGGGEMGPIVAMYTKPQPESLLFWPDRRDFTLGNTE